MKKNLFSLLATACICLSAGAYGTSDYIQDADDVTYDFLLEAAKEGESTDYVPHLKKIFKSMKVKTLLEFGVGYPTKYLLDSCKKVISVEVVTHGCGPQNIQRFLNFYQDFSNWVPLVYFTGFKGDTDWAPYKYLGSEHVYKAVSYQTITHKNYALIDDFYVLELNSFISNLVKCYNINIALVDPSFFLRGDLIQLMFDKIPVIVAHDTNVRTQVGYDDVYGYSRLVTPENYEEIYIPTGAGTTIWVIKNDQFSKFAQEMKKYASEL